MIVKVLRNMGKRFHRNEIFSLTKSQMKSIAKSQGLAENQWPCLFVLHPDDLAEASTGALEFTITKDLTDAEWISVRAKRAGLSQRNLQALTTDEVIGSTFHYPDLSRKLSGKVPLLSGELRTLHEAIDRTVNGV